MLTTTISIVQSNISELCCVCTVLYVCDVSRYIHNICCEGVGNVQYNVSSCSFFIQDQAIPRRYFIGVIWTRYSTLGDLH